MKKEHARQACGTPQATGNAEPSQVVGVQTGTELEEPVPLREPHNFRDDAMAHGAEEEGS